MIYRGLFKRISWRLCRLYLAIGLLWCSGQPLYAQEPTLAIEMDGAAYPTISFVGRCRDLRVGAKELTITIAENGGPPFRVGVEERNNGPVRIALLLDVSIYAQITLTQIAQALNDFNDLCSWGKDDQLAVFIPIGRGEDCVLTPLSDWGNDRITAANRIQDLADALGNPSGVAESDPALADLIKQMPRGDTALYPLIQQINGATDFFPSETRGSLVVFSDGFDRAYKAGAFRDLGNQARTKFDLFVVFLADGWKHQPATLKTLAGEQTDPQRYFELGRATALTLPSLWRQLENPQGYHFSYQTNIVPPFGVTVAIRTDTNQEARAEKPFFLQLTPPLLTITDPPLGALFAVTRTQEATVTSALTKSVLAQAQLIWPSERRPVPSQLFYRVNNGAEQTAALSNAPSQTVSLPLAALPPGVYQVSVRVDGGHVTLRSADQSFFEIRETNLVPLEENRTAIEEVNRSMLNRWLDLRGLLQGALAVGAALFLLLLVALARNRGQANRRDEQLQHDLQRLHLDQKRLAGSFVPMTASNWRLEQPKVKAALFLLQGSGVPEFIPILVDQENARTEFGSNDESTVRLWHRYIDDKHCVITYKNYKFFITDGWDTSAASVNGTFVNGDLVESSGQALKHGDVIQLGLTVRYSFRIKQEDDLPVDLLPQPTKAPSPITMLNLGEPTASSVKTQTQTNPSSSLSLPPPA